MRPVSIFWDRINSKMNEAIIVAKITQLYILLCKYRLILVEKITRLVLLIMLHCHFMDSYFS